MMGQTRDRKWGSSGSAQPRNRIPSALKRPAEVEQGHWAHPPSAVHLPSTKPDTRRLSARPNSRLDMRPDSRLDSRPASRLDSRPASRQDITRPKSGVRPLSGKVFMRRTTDHGWVAKAYNVSEPLWTHSQPELDLFDDISDCESLDSFFDEDFEEQTSEEKLGNLLCCNTLGVESKGKKPDWVAGKLGIPEFHCPRCRDHWYGLTDVPCEEELARLIREGLWKTGREGGVKVRRGERGGRDHQKEAKDRDYRSHSSITLSTKSSTTRLDPETENGKGKGQRGSSLKGNDKDPTKRKKRITFKLDHDTESGDSTGNSRTQLDNYGGYSEAQGSKSFGDGLMNGSGRQIEALSSAGGDDDGVRGVRSDGGQGRDAGDGGGAGGVGGAEKNKRGGVNSGDDSLDASGSGLLNSSHRNTKRRGQETEATNQPTLASDNHTDNTSVAAGGGRGGRCRYLGSSQGVDGGSTEDAFSGRQDGGETVSTFSHDRDRNDTSSLSNGPQTSGGVSNGDSEGGGGGGGQQRAGGKNPPSQLLGSSSQVRSTGSRRGSVSMEDHGKNVRKPGGYMRAVSPSSSEWGDPTHARPFISSTATSRTVSRCGSAVNLGRAEDDEGGRVSLPPIVPAISSKKPLLDLSDIMGGFQFTRAWTFSYHK